MTQRKILVVYYSRTGRTGSLGEEIARQLRADTLEVKDLKNRTGILAWFRAGRDAIKGRKTEIAAPDVNPGDYDLIAIGSPVWGSHVTPAIRTWIDCNRDKMKEVAFFVTLGGSGGQKALSEIEDLVMISPVATLAISESDRQHNLLAPKTAGFVAGIGSENKIRAVA